jgi:hypothetical protein
MQIVIISSFAWRKEANDAYDNPAAWCEMRQKEVCKLPS